MMRAVEKLASLVIHPKRKVYTPSYLLRLSRDGSNTPPVAVARQLLWIGTPQQRAVYVVVLLYACVNLPANKHFGKPMEKHEQKDAAA